MTPHVPLIARPVVHVDEGGVIYVHAERGPCLALNVDLAGHLNVLGLRHRLAPASDPELITRREAATELAELLERIAMSKTARKAVDHVINEYGS
jgi:hypothetical protein